MSVCDRSDVINFATEIAQTSQSKRREWHNKWPIEWQWLMTALIFAHSMQYDAFQCLLRLPLLILSIFRRATSCTGRSLSWRRPGAMTSYPVHHQSLIQISNRTRLTLFVDFGVCCINCALANTNWLLRAKSYFSFFFFAPSNSQQLTSCKLL